MATARLLACLGNSRADSEYLSKQQPVGARMLPLLLDDLALRHLSIPRACIQSACTDVGVRDDKAQSLFTGRSGEPVSQCKKRRALTLASVLRERCKHVHLPGIECQIHELV